MISHLIKGRPLLWLAAPLLILVAACSGTLAPSTVELSRSTGELDATTETPRAKQGRTPPVAPPFTLPSANGTTVALDDYLGRRNVVLVFYRGFW